MAQRRRRWRRALMRTAPGSGAEGVLGGGPGFVLRGEVIGKAAFGGERDGASFGEPRITRACTRPPDRESFLRFVPFLKHFGSSSASLRNPAAGDAPAVQAASRCDWRQVLCDYLPFRIIQVVRVRLSGYWRVISCTITVMRHSKTGSNRGRKEE